MKSRKPNSKKVQPADKAPAELVFVEYDCADFVLVAYDYLTTTTVPCEAVDRQVCDAAKDALSHE